MPVSEPVNIDLEKVNDAVNKDTTKLSSFSKHQQPRLFPNLGVSRRTLAVAAAKGPQDESPYLSYRNCHYTDCIVKHQEHGDSERDCYWQHGPWTKSLRYLVCMCEPNSFATNIPCHPAQIVASRIKIRSLLDRTQLPDLHSAHGRFARASHIVQSSLYLLIPNSTHTPRNAMPLF